MVHHKILCLGHHTFKLSLCVCVCVFGSCCLCVCVLFFCFCFFIRHKLLCTFSVFHTLQESTSDPNNFELIYGGTAQVLFDPTALTMRESGRLYHPSPLCDTGLVGSHLASRLSENMTFGTPTIFHWQGKDIEVDIHIE
eukprot:m.224904 g.224904  ORF g.224904 m.224904 type:complete len:139 (-) comp15155_c0_seq2:2185-2601(-)